jgi:hypothetical protein
VRTRGTPGGRGTSRRGLDALVGVLLRSPDERLGPLAPAGGLPLPLWPAQEVLDPDRPLRRLRCHQPPDKGLVHPDTIVERCNELIDTTWAYRQSSWRYHEPSVPGLHISGHQNLRPRPIRGVEVAGPALHVIGAGPRRRLALPRSAVATHGPDARAQRSLCGVQPAAGAVFPHGLLPRARLRSPRD